MKLFSEDHQKKLLSNNLNNGQFIFAEICGDANFNANMHPPLLEYEISYPTGEGGNSREKISTSDIIVVPSEIDPIGLELKHSQNWEKIIPLDLGFLNPNLRPPLFQLLTKFSPPVISGFTLPQGITLKKSKKSIKGSLKQKLSPDENTMFNNSPILRRPRVIFEDNIVIGRECWIVSKEEFPNFEKNESDSEYYFRVNTWRLNNNIPLEVYVRILPLPSQMKVQKYIEDNTATHKDKQTSKEMSGNGETKINNDQGENKDNNKINYQKSNNHKQRKSREYFKPQYIDFSSPLLCSLFGKMTINLKNYKIYIEEKLPSNQNYLKYGKNSYATEFIFQIDFYGKKWDKYQYGNNAIKK